MYRVLLVDDEELERRVLNFTLQNSGLPVEIIGEAAGGREAVAKAAGSKPDLIIMDVKMPGVDGIEATRQIKELCPATEVIILTAYSKFSYSQQAIKIQAADYLLKPIEPRRLVEAVKLALARIERKFQRGPALDLARLGEAITSGVLEAALEQWGHLLQQLAQWDCPDPSVPQSFGQRVMVIAAQGALSGGAVGAELSLLEAETAHQLARVSTLAELAQWGEGMLGKYILLLRNSCIEQSLVHRAVEYIEYHYAAKISLSSVAAMVHLSPSYLSRIFTQKTGMNFTDYLTKVRLNHAKLRLRRTTETVEQISAAAGFNSNSYFTAVFKKHEGVTPTEFRQNQTHNQQS